ncbi:glyoxalase bleomycin resistance protein dioxygenase protein [Botryosphaeria dothidea]|uniref:Glyoxalase bleomycin resistance protein dioxygenase protein n=1 Tax=Botryosphaeria dothidea TaxID=55169 RepID=A0A8H4IMS3_9PEZI|nr:glyoxalase bleomycin resistance protein dioxygenase protein [Botryosphaeria dothidea]
MTFSELSEERTSDVSDLWAKAIEDYVKNTGRDIKQVRNLNNTAAILKEQEQELDKFKKFRHNGQTTDKLRHLVSKNSELILSAAKQISAAASASFPPAGTILTAFTWVMKASKDVSADYDVILTFFDIQHSFLERISLLESRLPAIETYQNILMRVFTSILNLCSIATKYEQEGRFLKWAKALYKGSDEKLKGALDGLNTNIQRLESATMFATLRQTMDTSRSVASVGSAVNENLALTRQVNANLQETSAVVRETAMVGQQNFEVSQQIRVTQDKSHRDMQKMFGTLTRAMTMSEKEKADHEQGKGDKSRKSKDAGARRSAALAQVKAALQTTASTALALADIKQTFVEGTFKWLVENETYKTFVDGEVEPLLWIAGDRGLGKSNLSYFAIRDLAETPRPLYKTTVAHFFFKEEHEELRSAVNLLKSVVIQVAEADNKYREEVANEVKKNAEKWRDDDGTVLWERLFASKFPHESTSRLFLVIDGLDEADVDDRKKLLELLGQIKKDELQIRVLFTSGPSTEGVKSLTPATIPITIDRLKRDLRLIIRARIKSLSRLRKLRVPVKKRITFKLQQKADNVLYVEHVLRRLNSLRREAVIVKELEKLPDSLSDLYNLLLSECQKGRTGEEFDSLKRLFAWLAYSKRPLTLGEASNLVALVNEDAKLSLEEELEGRSARLLRLAQFTSEDEESSEETDGEASETADEGLNEQEDTDVNTTAPLRFQERSLRQYFREAIVDKTGLRSSPSSAHFIIFQTITTILTQETEKDTGIRLLKTYAADFWIPHFLDIQVDQVSDQEAKSVVDNLAAIVMNKGRALEKVEENSTDLGIFGETTDLREKMFGAVKSWIERALALPNETLTAETLQWARSLSENPSKLMEGVAEKHIVNWFNYANSRSETYWSFKFAVHALELTDILKEELKESEDYFTSEQILQVADAFPNVEKSGFAYRGISLVLKWYNHMKEGLELSRKSLEYPMPDIHRFLTHISLGDAALTLGQGEEDGSKKAEYIR